MSKESIEKLIATSAAASESLERATDYLGAKLLSWPYSWVIVAVAGVLAGVGIWTIAGWFW